MKRHRLISDKAPVAGETQSIHIRQNPRGYRYSVEPFLLAEFARPAPDQRVLEVGTGCGVISILLTTRDPNLNLTAVEVQDALVHLARQNVRAAGREGRIEVLHGDFLKLGSQWAEESFDYILSNPPYRKLNSGRINPCPEKAIARHELKLDLESLVATAARLLAPGGRLALAYPPYRREEVLDAMRIRNIHPARVLRVQGRETAPPRILLVEGRKKSPPPRMVEETLTLYQSNGAYTPRMQEIYASFNYSGRSHRLRKN